MDVIDNGIIHLLAICTSVIFRSPRILLNKSGFVRWWNHWFHLLAISHFICKCGRNFINRNQVLVWAARPLTMKVALRIHTSCAQSINTFASTFCIQEFQKEICKNQCWNYMPYEWYSHTFSSNSVFSETQGLICFTSFVLSDLGSR